MGKKQSVFDRTSYVSSYSFLDPPRNTAVSVSPAGELQDRLPVTLACSSDANPPVHMYTWYQGVACLPSADKSFYPGRKSLAAPTGRGRTLSTASILAEDYGQHCCVARNRHRWQTVSVTLRSPRGAWVHTKPNLSQMWVLCELGLMGLYLKKTPKMCVRLSLIAYPPTGSTRHM